MGLALLCFVLPAVLSWVINLGLRKLGWVKDGDMKLGWVKDGDMKLDL